MRKREMSRKEVLARIHRRPPVNVLAGWKPHLPSGLIEGTAEYLDERDLEDASLANMLMEKGKTLDKILETVLEIKREMKKERLEKEVMSHGKKNR
jgi:hypothetical protein